MSFKYADNRAQCLSHGDVIENCGLPFGAIMSINLYQRCHPSRHVTRWNKPRDQPSPLYLYSERWRDVDRPNSYWCAKFPWRSTSRAGSGVQSQTSALRNDKRQTRDRAGRERFVHHEQVIRRDEQRYDKPYKNLDTRTTVLQLVRQFRKRFYRDTTVDPVVRYLVSIVSILFIYLHLYSDNPFTV